MPAARTTELATNKATFFELSPIECSTLPGPSSSARRRKGAYSQTLMGSGNPAVRRSALNRPNRSGGKVSSTESSAPGPPTVEVGGQSAKQGPMWSFSLWSECGRRQGGRWTLPANPFGVIRPGPVGVPARPGPISLRTWPCEDGTGKAASDSRACDGVRLDRVEYGHVHEPVTSAS
jgi:hypothetical protein